MDAPLNKAHLEARKAERHEKLQKWEEAIASHNKAADLLLEAEKLTADPRMLESLRLQRDAHLRQSLLVEHRRDLSQFIYKYRVSVPGVESTTLSPVENDHSNLRLTTADHGEYSHYVNVCDLGQEDEEDGVYKTLAECDSLLHILNKRGRPCGNTSAMQAERNISATKVPKDERQIMEELKVQNDGLRVHVLALLEEADSQCSQIFSLHRENEELKQRLYGSLEITGDTDAIVTTSPTDNRTQDPTHLSSHLVTNNQPEVSPEVKDRVEVKGRVEDTDTEEEEEEVDYFLNGNMEFPSLELPPLEIPEY